MNSKQRAKEITDWFGTALKGEEWASDYSLGRLGERISDAIREAVNESLRNVGEPDGTLKRKHRRMVRLRNALNSSLEVYLKHLTPIFDAEMGNRVKQMREHEEWSLSGFAARLGISRSKLFRLEQGGVPYIPVTAERFKAETSEYFRWLLLGGGYAWRKKEKPIENAWIGTKLRRRAK